MNLLAIAGVVSLDVGLAVPTVVVASTDREMLEMKQTLDSTGEELARRVDWSALGLTTTVVSSTKRPSRRRGQRDRRCRWSRRSRKR